MKHPHRSLLALVIAISLAASAFLALGSINAQTLQTAPAADFTPVVTVGPGADTITSFIVSEAAAHPWLVTLVSIIGVLRLLLKPLVSLAEAYVRSTQSTADDAFVDQVEHSRAWKLFCWGLDLFGSLKIGPQFTAKPEGKPEDAEV